MATDAFHPIAAAMRRRARQAFTLVEVLLALAVTGVIGAGVVMMLAATASAAQQQTDTRRSTVKRQVAVTRVAALTRCNAMLLSAQGTHLVFWKGDLDGNGKPNLAELRRLDWHAASGELRVSEAPDDLPQAMNAAYELTDSFSAITGSLMGGAAMPTRTLLQDVIDWQVTLDKPQAQQARLMRVDLELAMEHGLGDGLCVLSALRAGEP